MNDSIVITGLGVVSPFGVGNGPFENGLVHGQSCLREITEFDLPPIKSNKGGLVPNFVPENFDNGFRFRRLPRIFQYATVATDMAIRDAHLVFDQESKEQTGIFFGTDQGAIEQSERFLSDLVGKGPRLVKPLLFQNTTFAAGSGELSIRYGVQGPSISLPVGYVSGFLALYMAMIYLRTEKLQYAIVVSADELSKLTYEALYHLNLLSPQKGQEQICRPFDAKRDGIVVSEGACAFVLETMENALQRGVGVYGKIAGISATHDTYQPADNDPEGKGIEQAMQIAMEDAQVDPGEIDYIAALANSSLIWDRAETFAVKRLFGRCAYEVPISSIKSMLGEAYAASGGFSIAACLLAFKSGLIPPTINYQNPDPECELDYVPNVPRKANIELALANSCSFGGNNSSIILGKINSSGKNS